MSRYYHSGDYEPEADHQEENEAADKVDDRTEAKEATEAKDTSDAKEVSDAKEALGNEEHNVDSAEMIIADDMQQGQQDAEASDELGAEAQGIKTEAGAEGHDAIAKAESGAEDQGAEEDAESGAEDQGAKANAESGSEDQGAKADAESGAEDQGAEANAGLGSAGQDTEVSDELGSQNQKNEPGKGFFARLFGMDEDADSDSNGETQDQTQDQTGDKNAQGSQLEAMPTSKSSKKGSKGVDKLQKKRDSEHSNSLKESIEYWQGSDRIPESIRETKDTLTEVMGLGSSFDVTFREMTFGGHKAALLCLSGFTNTEVTDEILKRLTYLTSESLSTDVLSSFMSEYIPHVQVVEGHLLSECIDQVLAGLSVLFVEGDTKAIIMDTRSYPSRSPAEPAIDRVVRGARDGFTETLLSNISLVRRRVRDPGLKYEIFQVGRRTRTDVAVAYIDDIVDKTQVQAVIDKIQSVDIDGIPLADKQLEEAIVGGGWNPYPMVRYSERPDVVASNLLEGRVIVFVDTSPIVIVLPTTFFDLCQHAEENRQTPFMGTYLRWVRFIGIFASMFLLPLWMLLVIHPELKPAVLEFIGPQKTAKIPILIQFLIVELGVDLLRMAAVHTPTPLGSAMGLIAAVLIGDIAVQSGLFVNEVVLYMAVASIGMFATPSYELGLANRIVRLGLLLAVSAFQVPGFMIGTTILIIYLTTNRSYNSSYMWPFIPFNAKAMSEILFRKPVLSAKQRPSFNKTRDNTRMPPKQKNE